MKDGKIENVEEFFDRMDEHAKRSGSNSLLIGGLEVLPPLEHLRACEVTDGQRKQARESELCKRGDMVLVWVNEGDLIAAGVQHF